MKNKGTLESNELASMKATKTDLNSRIKDCNKGLGQWKKANPGLCDPPGITDHTGQAGDGSARDAQTGAPLIARNSHASWSSASPGVGVPPANSLVNTHVEELLKLREDTLARTEKMKEQMALIEKGKASAQRGLVDESSSDFGDLLSASTPDRCVPLANTAHPVSPGTGASVPHLYTQETLPVNAATAKPDMNGKSEAEILAWKMYPEAMSKGCRALNLGRAKSGLAGKTMSWREIKLESSYMASTSDSTPSVLPPDRKAVNLERTRSKLRSEIPALMDIYIDPAIKIAADELTSMQLHRVHAAPAGTRGLHHARSLPGPSNSFSSVRSVAPSSIPLTGKWRRGRCSPCSGTCPPPSLQRGCCLCYRGINGWL